MTCRLACISRAATVRRRVGTWRRARDGRNRGSIACRRCKEPMEPVFRPKKGLHSLGGAVRPDLCQADHNKGTCALRGRRSASMRPSSSCRAGYTPCNYRRPLPKVPEPLRSAAGCTSRPSDPALVLARKPELRNPLKGGSRNASLYPHFGSRALLTRPSTVSLPVRIGPSQLRRQKVFKWVVDAEAQIPVTGGALGSSDMCQEL